MKAKRLIKCVGAGVGLWILVMILYFTWINFEVESNRKRIANISLTPTMVLPTISQTRPILVFSDGSSINRKFWTFDYKAKVLAPYSNDEWYKVRPQYVSPTPTEELVRKDSKSEAMIKLNLKDENIGWENINNGKESIFYVYPDGSGWAITPPKKDVYKINLETSIYKKLYSTRSYGECSAVFYWNTETDELYAASEYPVSSEEYLTNFCIVDANTGRVKRKVILPGSGSKNYSGFSFDKVSGQILVQYYDNNNLKQFSYILDISKGTFKKLNLGGISNYMDERHIDGRVIFVSTDHKWVIIYDIRSNKTLSKTEIPGENEYLYFSSFSHSGKYVLMEKTNASKYYLMDLSNGELLSSFSKDELIPNYHNRIYFEGWIE